MKGGFQSLSLDWKGAVFSLNGLHTVMFLTMIACLFLGNNFCTDINENRESYVKALFD
jgi:hypothetical protein